MPNNGLDNYYAPISAGGSFLLLGSDRDDLKARIRELVGFVLCDQELAEKKISGCGVCDNCRVFKNNEHPDVFWIVPTGASTTIRIDEIRQLREKINLKPYQARKKIFVIEEAERMRVEAANALLKTLEEPPSDALIILSAENVNQLLPTIISRCKVIRIKTQSAELKEPDEGLGQELEKFFSRLAAEDPIDFGEEFSGRERIWLERFCEELIYVFRDLLVLSLGSEDVSRLSREPKDFLDKYADLFDPRSLEAMIGELSRYKEILKSNANIKLVMDMLCKSVQNRTIRYSRA